MRPGKEERNPSEDEQHGVSNEVKLEKGIQEVKIDNKPEETV